MVGTCYLFCNTRQLAQLYDELLNGTVIKYFSLSLSFGGVLIRPLNREGHFTAKSDTQRRIGHTHTHRDDIQKGKLDARWKGSGNNEEFKRSSASPQTRQQVNARERERTQFSRLPQIGQVHRVITWKNEGRNKLWSKGIFLSFSIGTDRLVARYVLQTCDTRGESDSIPPIYLRLFPFVFSPLFFGTSFLYHQHVFSVVRCFGDGQLTAQRDDDCLFVTTSSAVNWTLLLLPKTISREIGPQKI